MSKPKAITELMNNQTFMVYYTKYKNIALNMFKWTGLPDTIRPEYIENLLFEYGRALFFQDTRYGLLCLQCEDDGKRNVYNEPIKFRAVGFNYNKPYSITNSVEIRNNFLRVPTCPLIELYSYKLKEIARTTDTHMENLKVPFIVFLESDKERLTWVNIIQQRKENEPVIFADRTLNVKESTLLTTNQDVWLSELDDHRHDIINELLTHLGINNANTDKKERLITGEVNANNGEIDANIKFLLESRQKACEEINKMFGLNISVEFNYKQEQEEQDDGKVHSGTEEPGGE